VEKNITNSFVILFCLKYLLSLLSSPKENISKKVDYLSVISLKTILGEGEERKVVTGVIRALRSSEVFVLPFSHY
jgi:hypothetical protein